ncbi:MAG: hypothetical protein AABZ12_04660 [Planctomycetota bacterium]
MGEVGLSVGEPTGGDNDLCEDDAGDVGAEPEGLGVSATFTPPVVASGAVVASAGLPAFSGADTGTLPVNGVGELAAGCGDDGRETLGEDAGDWAPEVGGTAATDAGDDAPRSAGTPVGIAEPADVPTG